MTRNLRIQPLIRVSTFNFPLSIFNFQLQKRFPSCQGGGALGAQIPFRCIVSLAAAGAARQRHQLRLEGVKQHGAGADLLFRKPVGLVALQPGVVFQVGVPDRDGAVLIAPGEHHEMAPGSEHPVDLQRHNGIALLQLRQNILPVQQLR